MRATMSVEPPAANGTMKRIGRLGQSSAEPGIGHAIANAAAAANAALIARQLDVDRLALMNIEYLTLWSLRSTPDLTG
jgi:hypothetical protein